MSIAPRPQPPPPYETALQELLHAPYALARSAILSALAASFLPHLKALASRMARCGDTAAFSLDLATGNVWTSLARCGSRLCMFCAQARSARIRDLIVDLMRPMVHPCFITLTIKSADSPLRDQLRDLHKYFDRLRRTKLWKSKVAGGVAVMEMTRNVDTGLWHPHAHVIADAKFIPIKPLCREWKRITGDSYIVDIRDVDDRHHAARELAKYVGKPQHIGTLDPNTIRHYASAIYRDHLLITFGNSYKRAHPPKDPTAKKPTTSPTVSLSPLIHQAKHGDTEAQILLLAIAARWHVYASHIFHEMPQLDPPAAKAYRRAIRARARPGPAPPRIYRTLSPDEAQVLHAHVTHAFRLYLEVHPELTPATA